MSDDDLLFSEDDSALDEYENTQSQSSGVWKILVTDDDPEVFDITSLVLSGVKFKDKPIHLLNARSAHEARLILEKEDDIAVILLDVVMETDNAGLNLVKIIREEINNHELRIILRTGQPGQAPERDVIVNYDINDYRAKTELTSQKLFSATISALRAYDTISSLEHSRMSLKNSHEATVSVLAALAEFKDSETGAHILRVGALSEKISHTLKEFGHYTDDLTDLFLKQIGPASMLHDVGKVGIPDDILLKPGSLDTHERKVMEQHATHGRDILNRGSEAVDETSYLQMGAEIAMTHHEHFDGNGYPNGLKGQDIPLSGRIVAVADVFDALISKRPYKDPWPQDEAVAFIKDRSGKQFDPLVVDAFFRVVQTFAEN